MKSFVLGWGIVTLCAQPVSAQRGIYFDLHRKDLTNPPKHIDHPHVDGALIRVSWAELEPSRGKYRFDIIEQRVAPWAKAGKKVIIGIPLTAPRPGFTPAWVFDKVPTINFVRTGTRRTRSIQQIKCWDPKIPALVEGLVKAFGHRYGKDDRIEAIMVGVGHLGFLTASPSGAGSRAFLDNGWTPKRWTDHAMGLAKLYRETFPKKTLLMRGSPIVVRARRPSKLGFPGHAPHFTDVRDAILLRAAATYNISVGANGLDADADAFLRTGIPDLFVKLAPGVKEGRYRLELSDDWPLWVPPQRRDGVNRGKDNAHFKTCLENAIGGVRGIPPTNISYIKMLDDDLKCTNPNSPFYQPDCEEKLKWFKSKLHQ